MDSRKRRTRREYVFDHAESESEKRIQIRPFVQKLQVHSEQKYFRGSFVRMRARASARSQARARSMPVSSWETRPL